MTARDAAVAPEDPPEPDGLTRPNCETCGTPLQGMFCHECGQQHGSSRGVEFLARDALAEALSIERKTVHTIVDMFARPGKLLNAYRIGASEYYFTPFKLLLVMSAAFFFFVSFIHVPIYQYLPYKTGGPVTVTLIERGIEIRGVEYRDTYLRPESTQPNMPELELALSDARKRADPVQTEAIDLFRRYNHAFIGMNSFWDEWLPRLLWLLAPAYTFMLYFVFRSRRFAEHALFTIWAHCVAFVVLMVISTINLTGIGMPSLVLFPAYLAFFTVAASSYYGVSRWGALWRGAVHVTCYALFVWFPVLFTFSLFYSAERVDIWRYSMNWTDLGVGHERLQFPDPASFDAPQQQQPAQAPVPSSGGSR